MVDLFTMLSLCSLVVSINGLSAWFTRIPSSSNPADDRENGEAAWLKLRRSPIRASDDITRSLISKSNFVEFMRDAAHSSSFVQPHENGGGAGLQ